MAHSCAQAAAAAVSMPSAGSRADLRSSYGPLEHALSSSSFAALRATQTSHGLKVPRRSLFVACAVSGSKAEPSVRDKVREKGRGRGRRGGRKGATVTPALDDVDSEILAVLGGARAVDTQQVDMDSSHDVASVKKLSEKLALLLSDEPLDTVLPPESHSTKQAIVAQTIASTKAPSSSDPADVAEPDIKGSAKIPSPQNVGDPLGKKVLGKQAVQWLAQGAAQLAAHVVEQEMQGQDALRDVQSPQDLVELAQEYISRQPMPNGQQAKCEQGLAHFPTVWDHVQREVQRALQAQCVVDPAAAQRVWGPSSGGQGEQVEQKQLWMQSPAWALIKELTKSGDYKKATRAPKAPQLDRVQRKDDWLGSELRAAVQARIEDFVERALALLELERQTELQGADGFTAGAPPSGTGASPEVLEGPVALRMQACPVQGLLTAATAGQAVLPSAKKLLGVPDRKPQPATNESSSASEGPGESAGEDGEEEGEAAVEVELERSLATLRGVVALSSRAGPEGQLLLTLAGPLGQELPPSRLTPGDLVCITADLSARPVEAVRWQGSRAQKDRLGEGNASPSRGALRLERASTLQLQGKVHRLLARNETRLSGGGYEAGDGGATVDRGAGPGASGIVIALAKKHKEGEVARAFGLRLCVERLQPLADATTYERNRAALEELRDRGLADSNPARAVVAALFRPEPEAPTAVVDITPATPLSVHLANQRSEAGTNGALVRASEARGAVEGGTTRHADPVHSDEGALFSRKSDTDTSAPAMPLDSSQLASIQLALNRALPVVAIQGPPGTGKTTVITQIICQALADEAESPASLDGSLVSSSRSSASSSSEDGAEESLDLASQGPDGTARQRGRAKEGASQGAGKVLACAPTNAAVDLLVERLDSKGVRVVRIGNPERVSAGALDCSLDSLVEARLARFRRNLARRKADLRADMRACRGDAPMREGLQQMLRKLGRLEKEKEKEAMASILESAQVILCTTTGAGEAVVRKMAPFSLVVLDEAGQATEPASWIPLLLAKRAILSGDPCQLAPTVLSQEASHGGLGISLIERAFQEASTAANSNGLGWHQSAHVSTALEPPANGSAADALHGESIPHSIALMESGSGSRHEADGPPLHSSAAPPQGVNLGGTMDAAAHLHPRLVTAGVRGVQCSMLTVQYRMNKAISEWSSQRMYQGRVGSSPSVAAQVLADLSHVQSTAVTGTPLLLLDTRSRTGVLQEFCGEAEDPSGSGSLINEGEADVVVAHVMALLQAGVKASEVAVQSPYQAQVQLIRSRLQDLAEQAKAVQPDSTGAAGDLHASLAQADLVEVATVDSFQGREAEAVVISMVRSNDMGRVGFLGDRRRMNVAVTRARRHLAVVCDSTTVSQNRFLRSLLLHIRQCGTVNSADNRDALYSALTP